MAGPSSVLDPVDRPPADVRRGGRRQRASAPGQPLSPPVSGRCHRRTDRWPGSAWSVRISSEPLTTIPTSLPRWMMKSVTCAPKRTSQPISISRLRRFTTTARRSIRPDVGVGVDQDVGRRPHLGHDPFDPAGVGVFDPAGQLAVGKGPRPAFSEMDMAFRIQDPFLPEGTDIGETLRNGLAPLQSRDGHPLLGKSQGGKKPCRSATDDDRSAFRPGDGLS